MDWGFGGGESISVFDHIVGKPIIHDLIHGKDYSKEQAALYGEAFSKTALPYTSARSALAKAIEAIQSGYGAADAAITQQGAVATRALLDRERQNQARSKQSLVSRGLYSTTVADAMDRAITSQTNLDLNDLNAQLALLSSNVKIGEAGALASSYGNLASTDLAYADILARIGMAKAGGVEQGGQGGYGGLILGLLGSWFGGFGGKAAGAAGKSAGGGWGEGGGYGGYYGGGR